MSARESVIADLRALLEDAREVSSARLLLAIGAVARVASGDAEDAPSASLADEADALLAEARSGPSHDEALIPATPALARWLADPRGPFSSALDELDHLGAFTAALHVVAPEGAAYGAAAARVALLAAAIADLSREESATMVGAAMAASERIAVHGVDLAGDAALVALADVLGTRLDAALAGEPLEASTPVRAGMLDASHAMELGRMLAKALGRATLDISPDLLELAAPLTGPASSRDVVLHGAEPAPIATPPVEILRGVHINIAHGELVADVADLTARPVMLVPIERGEPGRPCASRGGARPTETVFTLAETTPSLDGYALVVGDRIAFLRVRLSEALRALGVSVQVAASRVVLHSRATSAHRMPSSSSTASKGSARTRASSRCTARISQRSPSSRSTSSVRWSGSTSQAWRTRSRA